MDIKELKDFKLSDAVKFHDELNPNLWENNKLKPEVKQQLLKIANDFILELGIAIPKVQDITVSGSNAAYSYTPHSDLDLHILVDFNQLPNDEVYQELFSSKKSLYNDSHEITVNGVPVELYVQDSNEPVVSLGEYSIVNDDWIKIPKKQKANFDQNATAAKYKKLGNMIELALKSNSLDKVNKVTDIIKRYRKAGLSSTGEFGPENLSYKALRSLGYIQKLQDYKNELHSKELSVSEGDVLYPDFTGRKEKEKQDAARSELSKQEANNLEKLRKLVMMWYNNDGNPAIERKLNTLGWDIGQIEDEHGGAFIVRKGDTAGDTYIGWSADDLTLEEDWHPNDTPPGPEFKPTMPSGTVRVDVSDVYDWYKLGQHISNMKGLGKHDFGKGPPSTILSFGDEKYRDWETDRKSTRLNSSHLKLSRMPSSA